MLFESSGDRVVGERPTCHGVTCAVEGSGFVLECMDVFRVSIVEFWGVD